MLSRYFHLENCFRLFLSAHFLFWEILTRLKSTPFSVNITLISLLCLPYFYWDVWWCILFTVLFWRLHFSIHGMPSDVRKLMHFSRYPARRVFLRGLFFLFLEKIQSRAWAKKKVSDQPKKGREERGRTKKINMEPITPVQIKTDFPLISFIYFLYPSLPSVSRNFIESDHLLNWSNYYFFHTFKWFKKKNCGRQHNSIENNRLNKGKIVTFFFKLSITVEWQTLNQVVRDNRNPAGRTAEKMSTHHLNHPGKICKFALLFHSFQLYFDAKRMAFSLSKIRY